MRARVGFPVTERKFGVAREPKHVRYARLLAHAGFGRMAAVARITGMSERMLQFYMEPQSEHASPPEVLSRLLIGLVDAGADESSAYAILDAVRADLDRCCGPVEAPPLPEATVNAVREVSEVTQAVVRYAMDGSLDSEEMDVIRRELRQAVIALDQLEASASAKTESAPAG